MSNGRKYSDDYLINSVKLAGRIADELGDLLTQRYYEKIYDLSKGKNIDNHSLQKLNLEKIEFEEDIQLGDIKITEENKQEYTFRDLDLPSRRQITEHLGWSEAMEEAGFEPNPQHQISSKRRNPYVGETLEQKVNSEEEIVEKDIDSLEETDRKFCSECDTLLTTKNGNKYCGNCNVIYK